MKKGFTLAETLITIGIIGVVAALSMPSLISGYQKKVFVAQLQKTYNTVQNSLRMYFLDNNVSSLEDSQLMDSANNINSFMTNYFKTSKVCNRSSMNNCLPETHEYDVHGDRATCVILNTEAIVCMGPRYLNNSQKLEVDVDVNGIAGPNRYGLDFFPIILDNRLRSVSIGDGCSPNYGYDCFGQIVEAGWKMDY